MDALSVAAATCFICSCYLASLVGGKRLGTAVGCGSGRDCEKLPRSNEKRFVVLFATPQVMLTFHIDEAVERYGRGKKNLFDEEFTRLPPRRETLTRNRLEIRLDVPTRGVGTNRCTSHVSTDALRRGLRISTRFHQRIWPMTVVRMQEETAKTLAA